MSLKIVTDRGLFICFTGIDGSGKTLQARKLADNLRALGIPCDYVWCRYSPRLLAPLMWLAKRMIRRKKGGSEYQGFTSSKRGMLSKPLIGTIWRNVSSMEYLLQVMFKVSPRLRIGTILVCDRYVFDMVADLSINLGLHEKDMVDLLDHPALRLIPKPDKVFFLDIPPDVSLARKNDPNVMGRQYLVDRAEIYSYMCDSLGFTRVDAVKGIDEIAEAVLAETMDIAGGMDRRTEIE